MLLHGFTRRVSSSGSRLKLWGSRLVCFAHIAAVAVLHSEPLLHFGYFSFAAGIKDSAQKPIVGRVP